MGSGKRFRVTWMDSRVISLGVSVIRNGEHELSIHIDLVKIGIYIGFGKGYDE